MRRMMNISDPECHGMINMKSDNIGDVIAHLYTNSIDKPNLK